LQALVVLATEFMRRIRKPAESSIVSVEDLRDKKTKLDHELKALAEKETDIRERVEQLRKKIESEKDASHEAERELFQAMAKRSELETQLAALEAKASAFTREREN